MSLGPDCDGSGDGYRDGAEDGDKATDGVKAEVEEEEDAAPCSSSHLVLLGSFRALMMIASQSACR